MERGTERERQRGVKEIQVERNSRRKSADKGR